MKVCMDQESYLSFVYISLLHHVVGILYDIYSGPSSTFSIFAEGLPVAAIVLPTSALDPPICDVTNDMRDSPYISQVSD